MSGISRRFSISLGLILSMVGALIGASPAAAYPEVSSTYTGTSTADGFTTGLLNPIVSPFGDCRVSSSYALTGGWFYRDSSVITVGGLTPGQSGAVSIDYMCNTPVPTIVAVRFSGQALQTANTPNFGSWLQKRPDGFVVQIENYDSTFSYSASSSAGSVEIVNTSYVFVSDLPANTTATLTVTTSKSGHAQGSASATGTSLMQANTPTVGQVVRRVDGFDVQITNFDMQFDYSVYGYPGTATLNETTGILSVSGLEPEQEAFIDVSTRRQGYSTGYQTILGSALAAPGLQPTFAASANVPGVAGSFTFQVTNLDPAFTYNVTSTSGSAALTGSTISVTGASAGSVTVSVEVSRPGYETATGTLTHNVPGVPATPQFPSAFATNATTAFVTWGSVDGASGYTVTASSGGPGCTATLNFCTITGLTSGASYTFSIVASNSGLSSAAATTSTVVLGDQLVVGGSISSSTWKLGSTVSASPLIIGQYSVLNYQWYRCSSAVGAQVAPPACDVIGGANSSSYALTVADVGKFLTVHLSATGGVGVVTKTLANGQVALAADAAGVPTVDPEGKPMIANIPDKQVSVVGGTEIVINGTGFAGVTSVTVNGVSAKVIKSTDTSIIVSIPASTTQGLVDLVVTTGKGTATAASALAYVATPIALPQPVVSVKVTKSATLKPYSAKVVVLSAAQKKEIKTFVAANLKLTSIKCVATTAGVKKSASELKQAIARAKAACAYAKTINGKLQTSVLGVQGKATGRVSKVVKLTLNN